MVCTPPQNEHWLETVGLITDIKALTAIGPCKILHCKSPDLYFSGSLYSSLHVGLPVSVNPSFSLHTVSALPFNLALFNTLTQLLYTTFPFTEYKSKKFPFCTSTNSPDKPSKTGIGPSSGKGSCGSGVSTPSQ